ncbi:hypothetical protein AAF712_007576 [Marasmius tenuissimus]|uniref:Uncharacterized protein n=1 Tax=Marasmius tenuissimus TaxID=585030 RepID=A0ABR2ZWA1_9AGAR
MSHPQQTQQSLLRQFFCRIPYRAFQNAVIPMPSLGSISNEVPLQLAAASNICPEELDNADTQTVQNLLMPTNVDIAGRASPFKEPPRRPEDQHQVQAFDEAGGFQVINENIEDNEIVQHVDATERRYDAVAAEQRESSIGPMRSTPMRRFPTPLESPARRAGSVIVESMPRTHRNRKAIPTSNPLDHQRSRKISGKKKHTRWFSIATQGPLLSPPEPPEELEIEDYHLFLHIDTRTVSDYLTYGNNDYDRFITIWKWSGGSWMVINKGHPRIIGGTRYVLKINKSFEPAWVLPRA